MIGIELQSSDFGLSCFDGCLISFAYRLTQDDESALLDKSVWVFPSNDDYQGLANNPTKLTVDTAIDDNVSQYRKNVISVPTDVGATKLVFEIPTIGAISGDVLYLDNIQIEVPDGYSDDAPYVANVDGYNARAEARETIDEIKITKNQAVTTDSAEEVEKSSDKTKPLIIVLSVVVAAAVIVVLVIFIKKRRNRFY
jgi:hypothetical protein